MNEAPERTAVYRIRGEEDALLYIGMTNSVPHRWNGHMRVQPWWDELRSLTVEWYDTRAEAEAAEEASIKAELPKYNVTHLKGAFPYRKRTQVARPARPEVVLEPRPDDEDLLTAEEVAHMAKTSSAAIGQVVIRGELEGFWLGKKRVFRKGKVRQWIAAVEASQRGDELGAGAA